MNLACQDMLMEMEHSKKPIVAAIMGSCLGGGLEVICIICLFQFWLLFHNIHFRLQWHVIIALP